MEDLSSFLVKWDGPVRVVPNGHEVDILTSTGWKILAVYQEEFVESAFNEVVNPNPRKENDYNYTPKLTVETSHVCRQTRFVLGKTARDHLETLTKEMEERGRQRDEAAAAGREHAEKAAALETEVEKLREQEKNLLQTVTDTEQRLREQREKTRRMEQDLAKARKAMGELQWREIMGDPKE